MAAVWRNENERVVTRPGALAQRWLAGDAGLHDLLSDIGCVLYVHNTDDALTILDAVGATEMVGGYEPADLIGTSMRSLVVEEGALEDPGRRNTNNDFEGDIQIRRADGTHEWVLVTARVRSTPDGDRVFGLAQGLGVLRARQAERQRRIETDELTGLLSREAMMRRLTATMATTPDRVVVGILDLDAFGQVNDAAGLAIGDELLRRLGERLASIQADGVHLSRMGGDDFGICVTEWMSDGEIDQLVHRITSTIQRPLAIDGRVFEMRASIGLTRGADGVTTTELLRQADVAMHEARRSQCGHLMHTESTAALTEDELAVMHRLSECLEDELTMWFQPIVDLSTGATVALEALVRWDDPERGVLGPGAFLDTILRGGLGSRLDLWALAAAARVSAAKRSDGEPMRLAVNVTAAGLRSPQLVPAIRHLRSMGALGPDQLTIELSEQDIDEDLRSLVPVLHELRRLGVGLSLDDYGTGFSSLIRLRDLPFTEVKMDRSFVSRITKDHTDWSIVRSTVEMARLLELEIVAEGIEDVETAEALADMTCASGQGYLFARPAPFEELVDAGLVHLPLWEGRAVS